MKSLFMVCLIVCLSLVAAAAPAPKDSAPGLNTLAAGWDSLLTPTYEWINLYCATPSLDGAPLQPGDTIFVYDPDGVLCGIDTVRADGAYGFAPVYRDDAYSPEDEGALPGDTLYFAINDILVRTESPVIWTANGDQQTVCAFTSLTEQTPVHVDIKPGSCPNPFNLTGNLEAGQSVLPVAILGTDDFDVRDIDPATIMLAGAYAVRWSYEDVSRPKENPDDTCSCHDLRADGYVDLTLKFLREDIAPALRNAYDREYLPLVLTGRLNDGAWISGADCIRVQRNDKKGSDDSYAYGDDQTRSDESGAEVFVMTNRPNPFNPSTIISFTLPEAGQVALRVFDVRGRLVRTLADCSFDAGTHSVEWNATDGSGRRVASGIYFYRLISNGLDRTQKMILMK